MADIESSTVSETAAANTAAPPDGFPNNMARIQVKAVFRELMAGVKRVWARANGTLTTGGTQPDYTLTPATALAAYATGHRFGFKVHASASGNVTLNVSGVAAKPVYKLVGTTETQVGSGEWVQNQRIEVWYDASLNGGNGGWWWVNQGPPATQLNAVGTVVDFAGSTAPAGWLLCGGQAVSRTTYAALFAVIGTTYGAGDGSTTFNLPDCRGRATFGKDNMVSDAGRLTSALSGGINGDALGATGGEQGHVLTVAELASHAHGVNDPTHAHNIGTSNTGGGGGGGSFVDQSAPSGTRPSQGALTGISIQAAGSNASHNTVPPGIVFNKIIFAGV